MKIKTFPFLITLTALLVFAGMQNSLGAEEFLGYEIKGGPASYVVLRDVNLRSQPTTNSKRLKGLKKGNLIQSFGSYKGWVSIVEDGKPVGFAYKKFLMPMIDGSLSQEVSGMASVPGRFECSYTFMFVGKSEAGNEAFKMADYDVSALCKVDGRELAFSLFMFMTEGPLHRSRPFVHQISIDVLQFEYMEDYDEVFTTIVFYDHDKKRIVYEATTLSDLVVSPEPREQDATSVEDALTKTIAMTFGSWKPKAWQELAKELN